ncbi:AraC family transcriptional regulator [Cohnella sp. AR92]|uniref:AraC family transcriptional regulator n=1 Tax=Cohnella sp. AR92 TaxID=648716 RepID=UPI000F8CF198|nr:AraC family transcriptional regulator [Cohnella sp. AR92]RUS46078.1 AraC family transcriptional regulator [Cohnella sp. AR92]
MIEYLPRSKHHMELHLTQFGTEECIPGHDFGPAVRNHYLLHYIWSGEGIFEVGGTRYRLRKGQGFLICPEVVTYYRADSANPWSYCWFGFNGTLAEWLLKKADLTVSSPILDFDRDDRMMRYLQLMSESKEYSNARETRLNGLLALLLAEFAESGPASSDLPIASRSEIYVDKVKDFIDLNYDQKVTIADIAHYIGLNRSYLCSLFKRTMNVSIQDYLIRYRMNKACEMLENPELSVGDIARSVGYSDPLLFSKIFKKSMGQSPRAYRSERDGR